MPNIGAMLARRHRGSAARVFSFALIYFLFVHNEIF